MKDINVNANLHKNFNLILFYIEGHGDLDIWDTDP